jgi:hypothetical protein
VHEAQKTFEHAMLDIVLAAQRAVPVCLNASVIDLGYVQAIHDGQPLSAHERNPYRGRSKK